MLGIARTYAGGQFDHNLPATPSTSAPGTTVTANASTHTKGSYSPLIASTAYDWHGFWLYTINTATSNTVTDMLLDIAIGAAASEQIILPNLMCGWRGPVSEGFAGYYIPLFIPRGTRVSAACQAAISADTVVVSIFGVSGNSGLPGPLFTNCDAYGIDSATSSGTSHTAGNSGAESTDANVGGTTSRPYGAVLLGVAGGGTVTSSVGYHWELTIGGTTHAEWYTYNTSAEVIHGPMPHCPIGVSIPTGTQLQIQAEASGTATAHDVAFYCFY
jgi:hypothetical protein